jgi:phosphoadenosine phosphosulfate reductase
MSAAPLDTTGRFDPAVLAGRAAALESAPPEEILRFAFATYPRLAVSTAFGVEGCALVHLSVRLLESLGRDPRTLQVFTVDTDFLFPETLALRARLEERYGISVTTFKGEVTLERQNALHGERLYERDTDTCCALRKVEPTRRALHGLDAWIAGIRRDQGESRRGIQILERYDHDDGSPLVKVNPLANWTRKDTWAFVMKHDVPYNPLLDDGYTSIGCWPCTAKVGEGGDERAGRWGGKKAECGIHTFMIRK